MQAALDLFKENIQRSRNLTSVFQVLESQTTQALDLSDILRASLVMSVSALDHFIHETARLGMLEAYRGERIRTPAFLRFQVTLGGFFEANTYQDFEVWLDSEIRERHGYQSFQMPDRIAEAVRLIYDQPLWNEVSQNMGIEAQTLRERLVLIIQRRNKIAHEADIMTDHAGQTLYSDLRSPIDEPMVASAIDFIEQLVDSIHTIVSLDSQDG